METTILKIDGMRCAACVGSVEKALKRVQGVQSASVSLETSEATVIYDPAQASVADLAQAATSAGYFASAKSQSAPTHSPSGRASSSIEKSKGGCCGS